MAAPVREFSGRGFNYSEIELIKEIVSTYPKLSQHELAATICEILEWTGPSGRPKKEPCLLFLRKLNAEGAISLPALQECRAIKGSRVKRHKSEDEDISWMDMSAVTECGELALAIARPGKPLSRWRAYIRAFHALGDANVSGCRLCYTINCGGRDIGCMQFSASAWALSARDEWIGWTAQDKKARLHLVLNNSRTLILPWVRVGNLGSRALSLAARQIARDWRDEYCFEPVLLETFVDATKYRGTIYKASNWILVGQTKGRGRNDPKNEPRLSIKDIYMYPLRKDFREVLKGSKPYVTVGPDDAEL